MLEQRVVQLAPRCLSRQIRFCPRIRPPLLRTVSGVAFRHPASSIASCHRQCRSFSVQTRDRASATQTDSRYQAEEATPISDEEYHERADEYLEDLVAKLEHMQEQRTDLEVEYSAGVLTIELPSAGTYVLNKQPPNKQIWLSSPISGPKRYDWVAEDSMNQKEGTSVGKWVYLRDHSTLTDLLRDEVDVDMTEGTSTQ